MSKPDVIAQANFQNMDLLVKIDKLKMLYKHSYPAVMVSILASIGMMNILWPVQNHTVLLNWFAFLSFTTLLRITIFGLYLRKSPEGSDVLAWEKPYFITLILTSLAWGVGALFIMPADSNLHQIIVYCVLVGFSGGAFSYYSAHRTITITTISSMLLPVTFWFLFMGDPQEMKLSFFALLFFVSALRATKRFSSTLHQNFLMTHQLEQAKEEAENLARIDELTGLYNRRAFYENGKVLINHCQRNNEMLSLIVMDVDEFKKTNDTFGHAAGDTVLVYISRLLKQRLRKSDIAARIGGEEFGILLSTPSLEVATKVAEELRRGIDESLVIYNGEHIQVSASFGVATGDSDIDTLINYADIAMYRAKESGRNCVVSHSVS